MGIAQAKSEIVVVGKEKRLIEGELVVRHMNHPVIKDVTESLVSTINKFHRGDIDKETAMINVGAFRELIKLVVLDHNLSRKKIR